MRDNQAKIIMTNDKHIGNYHVLMVEFAAVWEAMVIAIKKICKKRPSDGSKFHY